MQGFSSPADRQKAVLDGLPLGLGKHTGLGELVDGPEQGVHELAVSLRASQQRRTLSEERQHCRGQIAVEGQGHVRACQIRLLGGGGQQRTWGEGGGGGHKSNFNLENNSDENYLQGISMLVACPRMLATDHKVLLNPC